MIQANERQHVAAWERAIAEYRKLVTEKPADGVLLTKFTAVYQSAGRTREAVALLAEASAANPKDTLLSLKVAALQAWFGQDREFADPAANPRVRQGHHRGGQGRARRQGVQYPSIPRRGGSRSGARARPHRGKGC